MKRDFQESMEAGVQPLDGLMARQGLKNHDLVAVSDAGLTHKVVAKARRGRKLTGKAQKKLLEAINRKCGTGDAPVAMKELFNYQGR